MKILIYLNGSDTPMERKIKEIQEICNYIEAIGQHRLDKVIISEFSDKKEVLRNKLNELFDEG